MSFLFPVAPTAEDEAKRPEEDSFGVSCPFCSPITSIVLFSRRCCVIDSFIAFSPVDVDCCWSGWLRLRLPHCDFRPHQQIQPT